MRDLDLDAGSVHRGAEATSDFGGPKGRAKQNKRAVLQVADAAKRIARISRVVRVESAAGEFTFESSVGFLCFAARTDAGSFGAETSKQLG